MRENSETKPIGKVYETISGCSELYYGIFD
jgi:hypothetical protein